MEALQNIHLLQTLKCSDLLAPTHSSGNLNNPRKCALCTNSFSLVDFIVCRILSTVFFGAHSHAGKDWNKKVKEYSVIHTHWNFGENWRVLFFKFNSLFWLTFSRYADFVVKCVLSTEKVDCTLVNILFLLYNELEILH